MDLRSEIPKIVCCSPFFQQENSSLAKETPKEFPTLKSFHDIDLIEGEVISNNLHKLKRFGKVNFPHFIEHGKKYSIGISSILILITVFYLYLKCSHLFSCFSCKRKNSNNVNDIVVKFQNVPLEEDLLEVNFLNNGIKF